MALEFTMLLPVIFGLAVLNEASAAVANTGECVINAKRDEHNLVDLSEGSPIYLYPELSDSANVRVKKGQSISIYCPGKTNQASTKQTEDGVILVEHEELSPSKNLDKVTCQGNDLFRIDDDVVHFKDITCEEKPRVSYNAVLKEIGKCARGHRYEIGFELGKNGFLKTLDLCHDKENAQTLWAHAVIEPINQEKSRPSSPPKSFKAGSLYEGMHMSKEEPYSLDKEVETLTKILGSAAKADKYLSEKPSDRKFLARGHLIAHADKFYRSEQDSTFFYANVVPMWQQINANPGNWFFVEEYVRYLAFHKRRELDVYVGGYETLELEGHPFHLYRVGQVQRIPVPRVLYKCVVDKAADEALCFLVVNNPYASRSEIENPASGNVVCKTDKRCEAIAKNHADPSLGYLYCCSLKSFYKTAHAQLGLDDLKSHVNAKPMELLDYVE